MMYKGIVEISNSDYHAEKEHLSSSNLKLLLKNPEDFYRHKVIGESVEYSKSTLNAFDEGSLAHSLILEPENTDSEFLFYDGMVKSGKKWEEFKNENDKSGKVLISKAQKIRVGKWIDSFKQRKSAVNLISGGIPECTLFSKLDDVNLKVRADYINIDLGYIVDIKTTSSGSDIDNFKFTIESFMYDLSASLYMKLFENHFNKEFEFYFIVLSKREFTCDVYKVSKRSKNLGNSKIAKALSIYKKCSKLGLWLPNESISDKISVNEDYEILEV